MGRKRKTGERYACGKLKTADDAGQPASLWQRIREMGSDPLGGSQVGRLAIVGRLGKPQVEAAVKIADIYARYERSIGMRRSAKSPSYESSFGGGAGEESQAENEAGQKAAKAFDKLQTEITALEVQIGRGLRDAIEQLVVEDRICPPGMGPRVAIALTHLAGMFGLTGARRAPPNVAKISDYKSDRVFNGTRPVARPASKFEQEAFLETMATLVPDMDADQAVERFRDFKARADRARLRAAKEAA